MNSGLSKFLFFTAGAAVGSVVTWKLVKTKYERIAQEEIDSVREVYLKDSETNINTDEEGDDPDPVIDDDEFEEYEELADKYKEPCKEDGWMIEPYVISPDEFDENGFETETLYYFEDGVVANSITKEVIKNPEEILGEGFETHFGEYEDDSVFIRNENLETDFEILRDGGRYSEVE